MRTVRTVAELRAELAGRTARPADYRARAHDGRVPRGAPVPHRAARERCATVVVVSLFVNPTQFDAGDDLAAYPRDEARDARLAAAEGVDLIFAPSQEEVYPDGFATTVHVGGVTETLEGARAARALRRRRHRGGQALLDGRPGRGVLRPQGRPAGRGRSAAWRATSTCRSRSPFARPCASPTGSPCPAATCTSTPASASARCRSRAPCAPSRTPSRTASDLARRRRGRTSREQLEVELEYLAAVDPDTFEPASAWRRRSSWRSPRGLGRHDSSTTPSSAPAGRVRSGGPSWMQRVMLKSKIHRATVTDCDLHYVGSITVDPDLLEAADILPHEQVHVVDVDNGARFETYTIAGERGSGEMKVNGAAARLVHRGDTDHRHLLRALRRDELDELRPAGRPRRRARTRSSPSTTRRRPSSPR